MAMRGSRLAVLVSRLALVLLLLAPSASFCEGSVPGRGARGRLLLAEGQAAAKPDAGVHEGKPQVATGAGKEGEEHGEEAHSEGKETIAHILDEALQKEFKAEEEKKASEEGKIFNETLATKSEAKAETVLLITSKKSSNHSEHEGGEHDRSEHSGGGAGGAGAGHGEEGEDVGGGKLDLKVESDVDRIIDSRDNEYVLSKPNEEGSMGLNLDPRLISDLATLITASALVGLAFEALGQPTINGYFLAGSLVGPGGLRLVKELVQVQSVAQLGVQLLLFSLGLEFSLSKLNAMRNVALLGGLLQVVLMSALSGISAIFIGASASQGVFLGALVSMSSTSIVVKCINDSRQQHQQASQITIATLVLQDCVAGVLFAVMPVLSGAADGGQVSALDLAQVLARMALILSLALAAALVVAHTLLPRLFRYLVRRSDETYQLVALAFCLMMALAGAKTGVSSELGAFIAGVMVSATGQQEAVLQHLEPVTHFFIALFIGSIGLILSPAFLFKHILVLSAGLLVVITAKTALFGGVVWLFRYPPDVALAVGMNLAQIGEFGFVLLSVANQYSLIPSQVYMLLMGVTALSLLVTPFLLKASLRLLPRSKPNSSPALELPIKRHGGGGPGSNGSDSLPASPLTSKFQSQTGQELGHRHPSRAHTVIPMLHQFKGSSTSGSGHQHTRSAVSVPPPALRRTSGGEPLTPTTAARLESVRKELAKLEEVRGVRFEDSALVSNAAAAVRA